MCKPENKGAVLVLLSIGLVLLCPIMFSLPAICDMFNLSDKGPIGDALGGMTAPIIGLANVILLYWTLREQVRINREQRKFNDANRVMNMSMQIAQRADELHFGYSSNQGVMIGKGLSSIQLLDRSIANIGIAEEEFELLLEKVRQLDTMTTLLYLTLTDESLSLDINEKKLMLESLKTYLEKYSFFYGLILESRIVILPHAGIQKQNSLFSLSRYASEVKLLKKQVDTRIVICNNY